MSKIRIRAIAFKKGKSQDEEFIEAAAYAKRERENSHLRGITRAHAAISHIRYVLCIFDHTFVC